MSVNEYYLNLPKKRMGSGALFFNDAGELLIVKPNYKDHWSIPGGTVDEDESPRDACAREIEEEIGLSIPAKNLIFLSVDYTKAHDDRNESLQFLFSGGQLSNEQIQSIKLQKDELDEFKFMPVREALKLFGKLGIRMPKAIEALKTGTAVYLENGNF